MRFSKLSCALVLLASSPALADTLTVGAGKTYPDPCKAIGAAKSGDTIEVDPGTYVIACKVPVTVTIRGVGGGRPVLKAPDSISNGKGILAAEGAEVDLTVENLEFTNAAVPDANGAGVRFQGRDLTVRACVFHDNQNGILSGPQRFVTIEGSNFYDNGAGDGQSHNLYINQAERLIFRHNWSHASKVGHLLKSRARENWILFNRLTDESPDVSDNVDLPNGGKSYLIGNLIGQANSDSGNMIRIGEEGNQYGADSQLLLVHNTLVNQRNKGSFVVVSGSVSSPTVLANNFFFGQGNLPDGATSVGNVSKALSDLDANLVDAATFDFHLKPGAACVDQGVDVSAYLGGTTLEEYVHPTDHLLRTQQGPASDCGAYELGNTGAGGSGQGGSNQGGSNQGGAPAGGQAGTGQAGSGEAGSGQAGSGQAGSAQGGSGQGGSPEAGQGGLGGESGSSGQQGAGAPAAGQAGQGGVAQAGAGGASAGQAGATAGGQGGSGPSAGKGGSTSAGTGGTPSGGKAGVGGTSGGQAGKAGASGGSPSGGRAGQGGATGSQAAASSDDGGCGCRQAGGSERGAWGALLALGLVVARRSGRRRG